ncbi:MAG: PEP-CTERM sorting domain-containing protein [Pseudomonadota bacterium]
MNKTNMLWKAVIVSLFISLAGTAQAANNSHHSNTVKLNIWKIINSDFNVGNLDGLYEVKLTVTNYNPARTFLGFWVGTSNGNGGYNIIRSHEGPGSFIFRANGSGNHFAGVLGKSLIFEGTVPVPPVPEPHEWALLLVGLGLIAYQLRRSARSAPKLGLA